MHTYLRISYTTGQQEAFTKLGIERLPEIGRGERDMLEDADMPEGIRQTELDSFLQRALTTPISSEQDFMESGKTKGTIGGGLLGGGIGALTGAGLGSLAKRPGLGALIGGAGAGTLGALIGRPLGAEAGRREHEGQTKRQDELGEIFTDPYKMQRELQKHLAQGRRRQKSDERGHERSVAYMGAPPSHRVNYNFND